MASVMSPALSGAVFTISKRPAVWILAAVWAVQITCFAYLIPYLVSRSVGGEAADILPTLLPARSAEYIVGSLPIWGGPVLLLLGAVISGGEYRTGTLVTLLPRFPERSAFLLGRFAAISAVTAVYALMTLALTAITSLIVALVESTPALWPGPLEWLRGLAAIWLIMTAFASLGFTLGVVTRSLPVAIGIGLLWTPGLENLLAFLTGNLTVLRPLRAILLSPSAGSLAAALAPTPVPDGTPGVAAISSPGTAITVLLVWVFVPLLVSLAFFRRRDVT